MFRPLGPPRSVLLGAVLCAAGVFAPGCGQGLFGRATGDAGDVADVLPDADPTSDADTGGPTDADADAGADAEAEARTDGPSDPVLHSDPTSNGDATSDAIERRDADPRPDADPTSDVVLTPDSGSDLARDLIPDTVSNEDSGDSVSKTVDKTGADISLGEARLIIYGGTFPTPVKVSMRRIPSVPYAGAWGPVFEISVPSAGLFRQDAKLVLQVQPIGANQPNLVLGSLDPNVQFVDQQWIWVSDSSISADQTQVSGSVSGFGVANVLQYAAVVRCTQTATCPSGQACNSAVCQQCPTSSPCAP
jgi:hypothetical protein